MNMKIHVSEGYLPVRLDTLRRNSILDFDLYIRSGRDMVLYRRASLPFTEKNRQTLLEANLGLLFIPSTRQAVYQQYLETHLRAIIQDPELDGNSKANIVYDTAKLLVKDLLSNPRLGDNIPRCQQFVEATVAYILKGPEAFRSLVQVMSFDYFLYTHSVNVCTLALALARHVGINDEKALVDLGTGAILHDVGKTRVPTEILNKPGRLTNAEMDQIKLHPGWGLEMVREAGLESRDICSPVYQHHERTDGSGYPKGLQGNEIHQSSKIVAIGDAFDAAAGAFTTLETMFHERDSFDRELLVQFTIMLGPATFAHQ